MPRAPVSLFCDGSGDFQIALFAPFHLVSGPKNGRALETHTVAEVEEGAPFP